jgi:hypothetical protein
MALILPATSGGHTYEQAGSTSAASWDYFCLFADFKIDTSGILSVNIVQSDGQFLSKIGVDGFGNVSAKIRTSSQNTEVALTSGYTVGTRYQVFAWCDLVAGELKYYLNGAQVGSTVDVSGDTFFAASANLKLFSTASMGVSIYGAGVFNNTVPTESDIENYPDYTGFSVPFTALVTPTGSGYTATLSDVIGSNDLSHTVGTTSGEEAPSLDARTILDIEILNVSVLPKVGWDYVVFDGSTIPEESILSLAAGTHDGSDNAAALSDSSASFTASEYVGELVRNLNDGSSAEITANATITVSGTLSGGGENDWDNGDAYQIERNITAGSEIVYEATTNLNGSVSLDTTGVVTITGVSGSHSFSVKFVDVNDLAHSTEEVVTIVLS